MERYKSLRSRTQSLLKISPFHKYLLQILLSVFTSYIYISIARAGTGKRIGTALMTDARVQVSLTAAVVRAGGSLGGLQILNLLSVSPVHQRIVSVGREPLIEEHARQRQQEQLYYTTAAAEQEGAAGRQQAFTFTLDQRATTTTSHEETRSVEDCVR